MIGGFGGFTGEKFCDCFMQITAMLAISTYKSDTLYTTSRTTAAGGYASTSTLTATERVQTVHSLPDARVSTVLKVKIWGHIPRQPSLTLYVSNPLQFYQQAGKFTI